MKTPIAARFSVITLLGALLYSVFVMAPGLRIVGVSFPRQAWIAENPLLWSLGLWLWLAAIFCWMWVMVSLMWAYLPAYRIASMLQSGLLTIGATLAIGGMDGCAAHDPADAIGQRVATVGRQPGVGVARRWRTDGRRRDVLGCGRSDAAQPTSARLVGIAAGRRCAGAAVTVPAAISLASVGSAWLLVGVGASPGVDAAPAHGLS